MELKEYVQPLGKWWWLIAAATLIAAASAFLATRPQPAIYEAQALVMVSNALENPNPSGLGLALIEPLANAYANLADRKLIRDRVMASLGISHLPEYTVSVEPKTTLIEINVIDTSPERAQAVANEVARQLVLQSPSGSGSPLSLRQDFVQTELDELERQIVETRDELVDRNQQLAGLFSARQIADMQLQIAALESKLRSLQSNYAVLLQNTERGAINSLQIVETADLPAQPIGPNKGLTILLAATIGFALATAAAYLLEYLDDTVRYPQLLQKTLGVPVLAAVPEITPDLLKQTPGLAIDGRSSAGQAYRILRTNLQFAAVDHKLRILLVTSPNPAEGKTQTAASLAAFLAEAEQRVVLVDADLHRPRQHQIFGLANNVGLTTALLARDTELEPLLRDTPVPRLQVLTSGPLPPDPAPLLGSRRMGALLNELSLRADIVVLDLPPMHAVADATILVPYVDGVILVAEAGHTRIGALRRAVESLRQVNAPLLGIVLNRVSERGQGYYAGYYRYQDYASDGGRGQGTRRRFKHAGGAAGPTSHPQPTPTPQPDPPGNAI